MSLGDPLSGRELAAFVTAVETGTVQGAADTAVFLDAFVVRVVLLPSVLELLGRRTWTFPTWLERRLPRLALDPAAAPPSAAAITHDAALETRA